MIEDIIELLMYFLFKGKYQPLRVNLGEKETLPFFFYRGGILLLFEKCIFNNLGHGTENG